MTFSNSFNLIGPVRIFALLVLSGVYAVGCAPPRINAPASADEPQSETQAPPAPTPPPKFEVTDRIEIKTSMGNMIVGLYGKDAPQTVSNFLGYVDRKFFDKKIFHRVIAGFMVQGGGYDESLTHGTPENPIRLELVPGLKHESGTISMARQPTDLHSATSQFFICVSTAPQLNGAYSAFGKLEEGTDVLYAISGVPTHSVETDYGKMNDVPTAPVIIESIRRLDN